ncbi:hypothetical protein INT46_006770 [Mucor plumbeus]|uniref:Aspartic peptidase DDI1-type domain-containing protein n=1 Tax=Mucor plumbeus TaxID=97098 RepID=A0A8H7VCM9_9FUNG|nr:hypothetical protein INT46_006770 [Mucor plumbeus]
MQLQPAKPQSIKLPSTQTKPTESQKMVPVNEQACNAIQEIIKSLKYSLTEDVTNRKENITIGQLLKTNPRMHGNLIKHKIQSYLIEPTKSGFSLADLNIANNHENLFNTTCAKIIIDNKAIHCLIDCGPSECILNRKTKEILGLKIDSSSNTIFKLGNNSTAASLVILYNVAITIRNVTIPINAEVLETNPMRLIIGNNWLQKAS